MNSEWPISRRQAIASTATALATAVAGCLGDDETPDDHTADGSERDGANTVETTAPTYLPEEEEPDYDGWFEDVPNFEGTVDERGHQLVFVNLAEGNLFEPPAVMVDRGTTVDWGWAGASGSVTVTHEGEEFDREVRVPGLELTFDDPGIFRYFSEPHRDEGMKGAIVVAD